MTFMVWFWLTVSGKLRPALHNCNVVIMHYPSCSKHMDIFLSVKQCKTKTIWFIDFSSSFHTQPSSKNGQKYRYINTNKPFHHLAHPCRLDLVCRWFPCHLYLPSFQAVHEYRALQILQGIPENQCSNINFRQLYISCGLPMHGVVRSMDMMA